MEPLTEPCGFLAVASRSTSLGAIALTDFYNMQIIHLKSVAFKTDFSIAFGRLDTITQTDSQQFSCMQNQATEAASLNNEQTEPTQLWNYTLKHSLVTQLANGFHYPNRFTIQTLERSKEIMLVINTGCLATLNSFRTWSIWPVEMFQTWYLLVESRTLRSLDGWCSAQTAIVVLFKLIGG